MKRRVAFANPAAVHMLGASNADDLVGKSVVELFDPTSTTRIANAIRNVAAGLQTSISRSANRDPRRKSE